MKRSIFRHMQWSAKVLFILESAIITIFVVGALWMGGTVLWYRFLRYYASSESREFYQLVEESKKDLLDLRKFRPDKWDEVIYLGPYQTLCTIGVYKIDAEDPKCRFWTDEGDAYFVFLKHRKPAFLVPIDRSALDPDPSLTRARIARDQSIFLFRSKGEFPPLVFPGINSTGKGNWRFMCASETQDLEIFVSEVDHSQVADLLFLEGKTKEVSHKAGKRTDSGDWSYVGDNFRLQICKDAVKKCGILYRGQEKKKSNIEATLDCVPRPDKGQLLH